MTHTHTQRRGAGARRLAAWALGCMALLTAAEASAQSAVYACGHIRRERETAIENLRRSGYTTAILFNVNVEADGTLTTDFSWDSQEAAPAGGIICSGGEYVFGEWQPHYADDIRSLVSEGSSISRLEICIGGWGNGSYGHIRRFIEANGCGPETALYRNFAALKETLPEIVAVNNDQEQDYDLETAVSFHRMLAEIGYKTTLAPYTRKTYWRDLAAALNEQPGTVDMIYLQTYGGGSMNNPKDWQVFGDVPMWVGYDAEASPRLSSMQAKFERWRDQGCVTGGFIWNYNSESIDQGEWARAINAIFGHNSVGEVRGRTLRAEAGAGGALHISGAAGERVSVYTPSGLLVGTAAGPEADITPEAAGPWIVTDGVQTLKVTAAE